MLKQPAPRPPSILSARRIDTNVYDATIERLNHLYDLYDEVIYSFSGGKDSTVILNLGIQVARDRGRLPIRTLFFDEEAIPTETVDYVRRVAADPAVALEWYCLPMRQRNSCAIDSPWWANWEPADEHLWVQPLPPEGITHLDGFPHDAPIAQRWNIAMSGGLFVDPAKRSVMVLGIRAAESLIRQRAVLRRTRENYIIPFNRADTPSLRAGVTLDKAYPIYDWDTPDVWTAPHKFGWDYNLTYDLMEMAGIPHPSQRCAPPYAEEPVRGLWMFKVCFPDIWDKIAARVPGADTAARYARTGLYSYGSAPEKPVDQTWEDFIFDLATRHDDPAAIAGTVKQLRGFIVRHYNKTADPILPHAKHPLTGTSWTFLSVSAARGNLKSRKQADLYPPDEQIRRRALYDAERNELEQQLGYRLDARNAGKVT